MRTCEQASSVHPYLGARCRLQQLRAAAELQPRTAAVCGHLADHIPRPWRHVLPPVWPTIPGGGLSVPQQPQGPSPQLQRLVLPYLPADRPVACKANKPDMVGSHH